MQSSPSVAMSLTKESARFGAFVILLYFFSGVVGLAYQVLWARMLSLQFGVSIFGVVITAAAFMFGLGMGAMQGGRWARRVSSPLRVFALVEVLVALYALSLPFMLRLVDGGIASLGAVSLDAWYGIYGVVTLLMIVLPAWAMGVGFPMVLRALEPTGASLARVYGLNTCGGAVGALLPLWLLPLMGWGLAVWAVALIGLGVAAAAWWMSRYQPGNMPPTSVTTRAFPVPISTLLAYAGVGAAALIMEIGWTRLFGMLLLRTEYVMAIILAVFLIGIGLGSVVARRMQAKWWFDVLPAAAGLFALVSLWGMPSLSAWAERAVFQGLLSAMLSQGMMVALLTLPVTLLLGAWLPLLHRRLNTDKASGALLYGANAVGAALGALVAGFVLIPWWGTNATIAFAALLVFLCGMAWARRRVWWFLPLLGALAYPVLQLPPVSVLLPEAQAHSRDLSVEEDALSITHVVERDDGQRLLLADLQRMDASSDPLAITSQKNQVRLPLLLHPQPQSVLFLGLGTGISAAASLPFPQLERTAVELSQGAIDAAAHWFEPVNGGISKKMEIVRDDARRFLRTADRSYDVIIGDLFHPDLVGRSALLSVQQFERARAHLNPGGVFVQWLALNQFDPTTLAVVLRSFNQVFDHGVVFIEGFRLALVAIDAPSAQATFANLARMDEQAQAAATGREGGWSWLGRYWGRIEVGPGPVQDEWAPVIEYRLPKVRYGGEMDMVRMQRWLLSKRIGLNAAVQVFGVAEAQREAYERAFVGTDLAHRAWLAEFLGRPGEAQRLMRLAHQANPQDRWISGAIADRMFSGLEQVVAQGGDGRTLLEAILRMHPGHVDSLKALWQLARERGDHSEVERLRQTISLISPFDSALKPRLTQ